MIDQIKKELTVLNEEYNMLTSSLEVSVSKHLLDNNFTVIWANDYYYELTGYTKEEYRKIFNNNCKEYFRNDPEEYKKIEKAVINALNNGEKKYDEICKMPCKNGKYIWIRFIGTFTEEIINGFPVIYVVYTNVNELIETQDQLKEEHQKLEKTLLMEEIAIECIKKLYKFQDLDKKIPIILKNLTLAMEADRGYILKEEDSFMVVTHAVSKSEDTNYIKSGVSIKLKLFPEWKEEFQKGNSITIESIKELKGGDPELLELLEKYNIKSVIIAPIILNDEIHSYLMVDNPSKLLPKRFSIIETVSYFISVALENEKLNNILVYNSYYDNLTGLFNRNKYLDDIEKFSPKNEKIGILFMDINGLKNINDLYGHLHGDNILKEAADILQAVFIQSNIYRIGGDEYVVLALGMEKEVFEEKAKEVKQRLFLSKECKGAIGYKWFDVCKNIEKEIIEVDKNMYDDKKEYYRHKQNIYRYRHENDNILALCNVKALQKEIKDGHFEIFLQPKVNFERMIIGAESLVRYRDGNNTLVMPNSFITLFENSRVINLLDYFVFEKTCQILKKWMELKYDVKPISINISRYTLRNIDFIDKLNEIWSKYEIPKYLLEIEVIENDEEVSSDILHQVLQRIKSEGYSLSIDDFGARYSNIALFIDNDLDTLKIDRSLMKNIVANRRAQLLISSFVQICNNLNIQLIVEGVETEEQFELLNQLNCDGIQGYLISKPIPIVEYEAKFLTLIN